MPPPAAPSATAPKAASNHSPSAPLASKGSPADGKSDGAKTTSSPKVDQSQADTRHKSSRAPAPAM
eukprot:CAMPEP_0197677666 /NCGR_PEP_ID=MMETSP1338-20131121/88795_1 /TAXON_ID=43686 ORGANISM="Pelagodinium beii, Strain RCC1491" /NCGR_SAMPLE_ID=MMETSP1338 /ASSEMBLY_ACC=CAM_ASM_000754 /LENGTH=65 /DNA_ID=CAMNT_0043258515 /DNA_START=8 /DNA_END=202 /DNA_ORIENTATION=+